jgi:predicted signal transduction protein with EAL and GGDEF domain
LRLLSSKRPTASSDLGLDLVKAMSTHIAAAFENAALYLIAITDELTRLYTRRHFHTTIEKKFDLYAQYGEKLTLLMIDVDNFKNINDTYGHPAGDRVLQILPGALPIPYGQDLLQIWRREFCYPACNGYECRKIVAERILSS